MWIARWLSVADTECLQEDGVSDYAPIDLALLGLLAAIATNTPADVAKVRKLVEDDMRDQADYRAEDEEPVFTWDEDGNLYNRGEHVASLDLTEVRPL